MQIVILAGGLGTRLGPLTRTIPKPMLEIEGKPFLHYQIELVRKYGIDDVLLCAGYHHECIRSYFGAGTRYGVRIRYSIEKDRLLGTAGALKKAQRFLAEDFMVMYGDSYLPVDFRAVADAYVAAGLPALMTVYKNNNRFDRSNAVVKGTRVVYYDKDSRRKMDYIDYGLSVMSKNLVRELPAGRRASLEDIFKRVSLQGGLAAFKAGKPFIEIGSVQGLERFRAYVRGRRTRS